jgi:hypothetical protein
MMPNSSDLRVAEATFYDWVRHYAAFMALVVIAGTVAGALVARLSRTIEATSLVVYQGTTVPAREFGLVGGAMFRSDATLLPAMQELGISSSKERFLAESVQLRPVPDARVLLVVGRASTDERARMISGTTAQALRGSLTEAGLEGLRVLRGGVTRRSLSRQVFVALGALAGALFGLGAAILLYRIRRPVLVLTRALDLADPGQVALLDGRASWLGYLRRSPRLRKTGRNDATLSRLAMQAPIATVVVPGEHGGRGRSLARRLVQELQGRGAAIDTFGDAGSSAPADERSAVATRTGPTLLVADARAKEAELIVETSGRAREDIHLVWIT